MALWEVVCIHGRVVYRDHEKALIESLRCVQVQVPAGVAADTRMPEVRRITNRD